MKKIITFILMIAMILGLTLPASAQEAVKDDLTAITEHAVAVLDLSDTYTDFSGSFNDGLPPRWYLSWSGGRDNLSVTLAKDGTITNIYWNRTEGAYYGFYGFNTAFSTLPLEDARAQAEEWLARLVNEGETARIDAEREPRNEDGFYEFSGIILYHGFETPVSFSMNISPKGLDYYYRSSALSDYIGDLPAETASVSELEAADTLLRETGMELYYITDGDEARLRYIPLNQRIVVDTESGLPTDMVELYKNFGRNNYEGGVPLAGAYMMEETAEAKDAGYGRALTETELTSIEQYAGALSEDALDQAARSIEALGLAPFALDSCSYSADGEGNVSATLRYSCDITPDNLFGFSEEIYRESAGWDNQPLAMKYVTLNAKTGTLTEVSTSYSLWDNARINITDPAAAQAFLQTAAPGMAEESAVCTLAAYIEQKEGLTFARVHDGYFFPENYLYVEINPTGTIDRYYYFWDEKATFGPSDNLISEDSAKTAYASALNVTLGFIAWPEAIDYNDPTLYKYVSWGYTYIESLRLAYYYSGTDKISGIDAITGEPTASTDNTVITYDDLEDYEQKDMALRLAESLIGFDGGSLRPNDTLTMRDAAVLLVSADGYNMTNETEDTIRRLAILQGFITSAEWDPQKELTHRDMIHMLIDPSCYGYTARLSDLWGEQDGYMQIAEALHMLNDRTSAGDELCTRGDAIELLYRFMDRNQPVE